MRLSYQQLAGIEKIILEFEESDWNDPKGGTEAIQDAIKTYIGPGEYGFDYNPRLRLWIIDENEFNKRALKKIFEYYLTRPPTNLQF